MRNNQDNQTRRGDTHTESETLHTRPPVLAEVVLGDALSSKRIQLQKDLQLAQNVSTPMNLLESASLIVKKKTKHTHTQV